MMRIGSAKAGSRASRSSAARARSPSEDAVGAGLSKAAARATRTSGVGAMSGAAERRRAWAMVVRIWMAVASSRVVIGWAPWGRVRVWLRARWLRAFVCRRVAEDELLDALFRSQLVVRFGERDDRASEPSAALFEAALYPCHGAELAVGAGGAAQIALSLLDAHALQVPV